jgi:hypothetical protein
LRDELIQRRRDLPREKVEKEYFFDGPEGSLDQKTRRRIMRIFRFALAVALMFLSTVVFAQSEAQKAFQKLKTLEGSWEGISSEGDPTRVWLRVTSSDNAIFHELKGQVPDDPITMLYLEADRLLLTHYCDAGNRPRMTGKLSPDGKTIEFDFLDVANYNSKQGGHMHRAVFTIVDGATRGRNFDCDPRIPRDHLTFCRKYPTGTCVAANGGV